MNSPQCVLSAFIISLTAVFSSSGFAQGEPVLKLSFYKGSRVISTVEVIGCGRDPNVVESCDYKVLIDGSARSIPEKLGYKLNSLRRSFSYDALSGQIASNASAPVCRMMGDANGRVLEARYLTYGSGSAEIKILNDEMKPVFSKADNCLFATSIFPKDQESREDARAVMEILTTIKMMQ